MYFELRLLAKIQLGSKCSSICQKRLKDYKYSIFQSKHYLGVIVNRICSLNSVSFFCLYTYKYLYFHLKGIVHPEKKNVLTLRPSNVDEFVSSTELIWRNQTLHHLISNGSSAVNGCCQNMNTNIVMFSSAVWILILTATHSLQRIHWCASDVVLHFYKPVLKKKQIILHLKVWVN